MFGLFKRSKLNNWEIDLLKEIFKKLGTNYLKYTNQIQDGLFRGVIEGAGDIPNYVAFSCNSAIFKKYEDKKGKNFVLRGINVFDKTLNKYIVFNVYVSFGVINGYATPENKKPNPDFNKIDVSAFVVEYIDNKDFEEIKSIFTNVELGLINISEVYAIEIDNKIYYHIKDLEDGNFIGIDNNKKIYKFTHDPYEIVLLDENLETILGE